MKSPSMIKELEVKLNSWFPPFKKYSVTWFGTVWTQDPIEAENAKTPGSIVQVHEMIHVKQAISCKDSWFIFYFLYVCQWVYNLPLIFIKISAPYCFIPFELEAYRNEYDPSYLDRDQALQWKAFRNYSIKERWKFAKEYFSREQSFPNFIKERIM